MGSWTKNLSTFGGYNPGDGKVVIAGFFSQGQEKTIICIATRCRVKAN